MQVNWYKKISFQCNTMLLLIYIINPHAKKIRFISPLPLSLSTHTTCRHSPHIRTSCSRFFQNCFLWFGHCYSLFSNWLLIIKIHSNLEQYITLYFQIGSKPRWAVDHWERAIGSRWRRRRRWMASCQELPRRGRLCAPQLSGCRPRAGTVCHTTDPNDWSEPVCKLYT